MKLRLLLILILILTISDSVIFSQDKKQTVAVLEFNSNSRQIGKEELATLTSRFRTMLVKTDAFDVLERQKMSDILKEQDFTLSDNCNSAECAVQVGQLLGVEFMIAGDLGKLGDTYSIDLRLISVSTGKIIQTESHDHEGRVDGLFGALTTIANLFAGIKSDETSDAIRISKNSAEFSTFTDPRDGQKYKTVKIGNQIWMAENLNYETPSGSWCYDNISTNCEKYGRLYSLAASKLATPSGWHVPDDYEWKELIKHLGGASAAYVQIIEGGSTGFNMLFGGHRTEVEEFVNIRQAANFWSSSSTSSFAVGFSAFQHMRESPEMVKKLLDGAYMNGVALSVRCVKD